MQLPNVTISIPVRDRDWVLPWTIFYLTNQNYPEDLLAFRFIAHNCTDGSLEILKDFQKRYNGAYRYIDIIEHRDDTKPDGRNTFARDRSEQDPRHAQARLKNMLLDALSADEWWFFCDSDILLYRNCIWRLVETRKDIVGGLANVNPTHTLWNYFPLNEKHGMPFRRDDRPVPVELTQVGLVAGILLYSPAAWSKVRFAFIGVGEDEAAIRCAEGAGIPIWLEPRARGEHVMAPEYLNSALMKLSAGE